MWRQAADRLRDMIDSAEIEAGGKLPSEAELAVRFGINRHTVRAAVADLAREGLLRSEQGRGTFVTARPRLNYPIGRRTRFSEGLDGQASEVRTLVLDEGVETATRRIADLLDIEPGTDLVRIETIGFADRVPVSVATHWFVAAHVPNVAALVRATGSISRSLEALGLGDYVRLSTQITARRASPQDAEALRLAEGTPTLAVQAVNAHGTRRIQLSQSRFAADRIALTVPGELNPGLDRKG